MAGTVRSHDIEVDGGRVLRTYDTGERGAFAVVWHHGSPQTGALLPPLVAAAEQRGLRLISYARPSYGGSGPLPGRTVASAACDVAAIADALEVERLGVMGASGGGPHALACAALLGERVSGAVCLASIAPRAPDLDYFTGMASPGGLRAAIEGRDARARFAETEAFDETSFTAADREALAGTWSSLGADAGAAGAAGFDGLIDDDVAFVSPWGFDLPDVLSPVLVVQGGEDRVVPPAHAEFLERHLPRAELWLRPHDGHVSVLDAAAPAMDWLVRD